MYDVHIHLDFYVLYIDPNWKILPHVHCSSFLLLFELIFCTHNNKHSTDNVNYIPQIQGMICKHKILTMTQFSMWKVYLE